MMTTEPNQTAAEALQTRTDNATLKRVHAMVAPIIADLQLDLYDLEFRGGTLRVTIDTAPGSPGGVDLEQIALATRLISRELDHTDPVPGHYTLEVTSPGLERSLRTPTHFQRELGKVVAIRLRDVVAGQRRIQGELVAATERDVTLRIDGPDGPAERTVNHSQIDRAKTVFEWGPTPKPGSAPKAKKPSRQPTKRAEPTTTQPASAEEA